MRVEAKPIRWIGSSRKDLRSFPKQVRSDFGKALYAAQQGETDPAAKPMKGFGGAHVMEVSERHDTNTYRAVYTAQFTDMIYVLHAFQKKSTQGIKTPQPDIELIRRRFREAERLERERRN